MSVLSIFAPTSTDREYVAKLLNDLSPRNCDSSCHSLHDLLLNTTEITRKDLIPAISKLSTFLDQGHVDQAAVLASSLVNVPQRYFKAGDFKQTMSIFVSRPDLHSSKFAAPFLGLCEKSLTNEADIPLLIDDPMDLVPIASVGKNPMVTAFIVRVAQLVPALRVPFTFNGLIEQILPTIASNRSHLSLLQSLLSDPQSRQYFCDMGHIPSVVSALFDLAISSLATDVFRALLDPNDLLHLANIQKKMFELAVPKQLVVYMTMNDSSDETIQNAAICLADCLKYCRLESLPFHDSVLFELINSKPHIQNAFLYLFETIAVSNPHLFPKDETVVSHISVQTNPFALLFLSYLSYSCWRKSALDFSLLASLTGHNLSLALACATQRHVFFPNADIIAQSPENESNRAIACANCLFSGKGNIPKNALVHYISLFFDSHGNYRNPLIFPTTSVQRNEFYPESFLFWGKNEFNEINRARFINDTVTYDKSPNITIFDMPPDQAHVNLLEMNARTRNVMRDNDTWKARYEALEAEHAKLTKDYSRVEMELIESQCQHLLNLEAKSNEYA